MLTSLSQDKINLFPHYVQKWTRIGYDTSPINVERATAAINKMYECGGLKAPARIVFCKGPIEAILTLNMYMYKKENPKATKAEVFKHVKANCVYSTCGSGQHDAGWLSFYDFFRNETDLKDLDVIEGLIQVAKECGWYWAYDDICFVSHKPLVCKVNDNNQLHCPDGPAIQYGDGTEVYAYDGVIMDKETICNHASITVKGIADTDSEEQKRIKIEIYGTSRYLQDIKASVVDMDMVKINKFDPDSDAIPRALIKDAANNFYLVGTDGSTHRTYYMNVPNSVKTCQEAHNAIAPLDEDNCIARS